VFWIALYTVASPLPAPLPWLTPLQSVGPERIGNL
jgi:hypothetical protein